MTRKRPWRHLPATSIALALIVVLTMVVGGPQASGVGDAEPASRHFVAPEHAVSQRATDHGNGPGHLSQQSSSGDVGDLPLGTYISAFSAAAQIAARCSGATTSFPTCIVDAPSAAEAQMISQLNRIEAAVTQLSQQSAAQYQALSKSLSYIYAKESEGEAHDAWYQIAGEVSRAQNGVNMWNNYLACAVTTAKNTSSDGTTGSATCAKPSDAGIFPTTTTVPATQAGMDTLQKQFIRQQRQQKCRYGYPDFQTGLVGTNLNPYQDTEGYAGLAFQAVLNKEAAALGVAPGDTFSVFRPSFVNTVSALASQNSQILDQYMAACSQWARLTKAANPSWYIDAATDGVQNGDGAKTLSMSQNFDTYSVPGWSPTNPMPDGQAIVFGPNMQAADASRAAMVVTNDGVGIYADPGPVTVWGGRTADLLRSSFSYSLAEDLGQSGTTWSVMSTADFGGGETVFPAATPGKAGAGPGAPANPAGQLWAAPEPLTKSNMTTTKQDTGAFNLYFWNVRTNTPGHQAGLDDGWRQLAVYTNFAMPGEVGNYSLLINTYDKEFDPVSPEANAVQTCQAANPNQYCTFENSGWPAGYAMPYPDTYLVRAANVYTWAFNGARVPVGIGQSWLVSGMDNGLPYNADTVPPAVNLKGAPFSLGGIVRMDQQSATGPDATTVLRVNGRAKHRALSINHRNVLVRSVRTNGRLVSAEVICTLHGNRLPPRHRLCDRTIKAGTVTRDAAARGHAAKLHRKKLRITHTPTCSNGLQVTVRITAKTRHAKRATYTRTHTVRGHVQCRIRGNG